MAEKTGAEKQTAQKEDARTLQERTGGKDGAVGEHALPLMQWSRRATPCDPPDPLRRLHQPGWQTAQRRALAVQIGKDGGNRLLQRWLAPRQGTAVGVVQRWPWSTPEPAMITNAEEQVREEAWPTPGLQIVQEPLEGGGSRSYTAADESTRQELLADCRAGTERAAGLARALEERDPEDRRLPEMADIYTRFLGVQRAVRAQQPWSAEALHRYRTQLEALEDRQAQVLGRLVEELQPRQEGGRPANTFALEQRLQANIRQLSRRRRILEQMLGTMERRHEAVSGIQTGMRLLQAIQLLEAVGGQDLATLGGEAMSVTGHAGPFVGTSSGTATTVTGILQNSGLDLQVGLHQAWVDCSTGGEASPSECLMMATEIGEDPRNFLGQIERLAEAIEADVAELRSLQAGRAAGR